MVGFKYKNIYQILDAIAPQNILIDNGNIYIFDKINIDEGRLYRFSEDFKLKQLIIEVDDGECFFGRNGRSYVLNAEDDSVIEVYDLNGNKEKDISMVGTTYFIDVDESGNIFAIFMEDDGMSIRMYNNNGEFIRSLHSRNLSLLSNIYCEDEYIYAAGLSHDIPMRIEKINYMSYIVGTYDISLKNPKQIITKIVKYDELLIAVLSGDKEDTIVVINEKSGEKYEIDPGLHNMQLIYDIAINDNTLYILGNDSKIAEYEMLFDDVVYSNNLVCEKCRDYKSASYRYLPYLICIKNLPCDMLNLFFKVAAPLTLLLLFYSQFGFVRKGLALPALDNFRYFILLSSLLTISSVIIKNLIVILRKRWRLDNLLDIYNKIDGLNAVLLKSSILTGTVLLINVFTVLYGRGYEIFTLYILSIVSGLSCTTVLYYLCVRFFNKLKSDIRNIVFELLSLKMDEELFRGIAGQVKKLRRLGVERYKIKVHFKKNSIKDTVKRIKRWSCSRRKITGDYGILKSISDYIVFELNLRNRDIKYSRISVIEDFICYITNPVNISSVTIETTEDDDKMAVE